MTAHKTLSFALVAALGFSGSAFAADAVKHDFKNFDEIVVDGLIDVNIKQGKTFSVESVGSEKARKDWEISQKDGRLIATAHHNKKTITSFSGLDEYVVTLNITMPSLTSLNVDGLSDVVVDMKGLKDVSFRGDGIVDMVVDGSCVSVDINMDGMTKFDARNFKCEKVDVRLDGMGEARVHATEASNVRVDGLAKVVVYGNPKTKTDRKDGFGSIKYSD